MKKFKEIGLILLFSVVVGSVVGALTVAFGKGLLLVSEWRGSYFLPLIFFLPFAGLLIEWLYTKFGGTSRQGMGLVFDVGLGREEKIPLRLIPLVTLSTWLTHLFGGSAGREGVAVQIGATFANWLSRFKMFKLFSEDFSQIALMTGMAAGFAGLFQVPVAATFFALEVLVVGKLAYETLLSASVASFTAYFVSQALGLEKFSFFVVERPAFSVVIFMKLILLGLVFGLVGYGFTMLLRHGKKQMTQWFPSTYRRIFFGGLLLVVLLLIFHQGRYSGLGSNLIDLSLGEGKVYTYDFILKLVLTVLTLSVGFQGGEVTPLFAIGSSLGAVLAPVFDLPIPFVAALGYATVFGSATNTLIAPLIIVGEVFGFEMIPYMFVVMCFAYHSNFNQSIYGKQERVGWF